MFSYIRTKDGQNMLEYTVMIIVVVIALVAMGTYMQRSMNARLKQIQEELNESRR